MKKLSLSLIVLTFCSMVKAQNIFEKDYTKPGATEIEEPKPKIVVPGVGDAPPSDAIVLFNGGNLDNWVMSKDHGPCVWKSKDGVMTVNPGTGDIQTEQKFGDCQLHVEFKIPLDTKNTPNHNNAGNSGVYIQERYEIQIFNSYNDETPLYANGQIGSIYKQVIPMANASSKPGDWNTFDIYYTAPRFRFNGTIEKSAFITVVHNKVLILNHFEIQGTTQFIGIPHYELHNKAAIKLQDHGSQVSFKNVWIREL